MVSNAILTRFLQISFHVNGFAAQIGFRSSDDDDDVYELTVCAAAPYDLGQKQHRSLLYVVFVLFFSGRSLLP